MKMLQDRNLTPHTYNEILSNEITHHIAREYYSLFTELKKELEQKLK